MRPLWAIRARASQLGRSAPCTRETTASDTRNLSSSKSCGSEPVRARSVRPQSMSTRRSAELSRRTCSPSRALQDCCGDHPQPMQTEAARARARSTTRTHCVVSYQVKYCRRFTRLHGGGKQRPLRKHALLVINKVWANSTRNQGVYKCTGERVQSRVFRRPARGIAAGIEHDRAGIERSHERDR